MMRRFMGCLTLMAVLLVGSAGRGAGLWMYETGSPDVGTAAAGRAAMAADASAAGANPAGMTRLDRSQLLVGLQGLYLDAHFDTQRSGFGGSDGGNAGGFVPVGSFHYVHRLNPDWSLGLSVGSYFGLGVDYGDDWSGRYYIKEAELVTFGVNPGVGYRAADWLSVGAGFTVMQAKLHQTVGINNAAVPGQAGLSDGELKFESDDVGYGFNLGILLELTPYTRFGITYRSEVKLEFKDVANLSGLGPVLQGILNLSGLAGSRVDIDMTVPQTVMVSGYHQLTPAWAVVGNIGWQESSEFGKQEIACNLRRRAPSPRTSTTTTPGTSRWAPNTGSPRSGSGPSAPPTIPRRSIATKTAPRTSPWTARSDWPQGCSMTGTGT